MDSISHRSVAVNGINMHIAEKGDGPVILFLHGFPELWYTWRHQILSLAARGYRAVAPDLRGYGDTDAPPAAASYSILHIVGDLVALIDALGQEQVFVVGHDWGAMVAWSLCVLRPDMVKALVNMSVVYTPRNPARKPLDSLRAVFGEDYYICRFQSHADAVCFRFKRISNWEDIVDLCGKDRATGQGTETSVEATEIMTPLDNVHPIDVENGVSFEDVHIIEDSPPTQVNEKRKNQVTPSYNTPPKKGKSTKDVIGSSVDRMTTSFEEFIRATTQTLSPKEVWNKVMAISDLTTDEQIKACAWFIENDKQFLMLEEVPMAMKKSMVLMFISGGST